MLRNLFIKSLFLFVLPISTGFAMKETKEQEAEEQNNPSGAQEFSQGASKLDAGVGEKIGKHKTGENTKIAELGALSSIFVGAFANKKAAPVFVYRRATFFFFFPLVFNSLLNFIFELDNKPSGKFLNFFSFGWRTPPFLKFMTFDIHFNWLLFAISAYFDFAYFPDKYCPDDPLDEIMSQDKNIIPFFLSSFVFSAVSLCVNFKVDDYFYITVNLSYFLLHIANVFLSYKKNNAGIMTHIKKYLSSFTIRGGSTADNQQKGKNKDNLLPDSKVDPNNDMATEINKGNIISNMSLQPGRIQDEDEKHGDNIWKNNVRNPYLSNKVSRRVFSIEKKDRKKTEGQ